MKTLLITPTYNEIENLRPLLEEIFSYVPETDVLIVDDHSPDGTGELADEIHEENPQVKVLHRPGKLGLGTAYIAGFKYAIEHGYDAAFEMDADFSHDPRYLPDFLQAIEHADLVIGSRYIPGGYTPNWSPTRRRIVTCPQVPGWTRPDSGATWPRRTATWASVSRSGQTRRRKSTWPRAWRF